MKNILPKCTSTKIASEDFHIWMPANFDDFLLELDHITSSCTGEDPLPLFRGHSNSVWTLDSTFVRTCKKILFDLPPHKNLNATIKESLVYNNVIQNLYLLKYGFIVSPGGELENIADTNNVDTWFEVMRLQQQFPEKDTPYLKGTFLLDWTKNKDVALFFANNDNDNPRMEAGAVYICDAAATGKTLIRDKKVGAILDMMFDKIKKEEPMGVPLMFYPPKQIKIERANNQQVVYFAQMDLRYSFEEIWKEKEKNDNEIIYVKLMLPKETQEDCQNYLLERGMTKEYLLPSLPPH